MKLAGGLTAGAVADRLAGRNDEEQPIDVAGIGPATASSCGRQILAVVNAEAQSETGPA